MPRSARLQSDNGVYHVMTRGINRQKIFIDREDRVRYLETLDKIKIRSGYQLYAYCLMDNHVHLLIAEKDEEIGQMMKRIGSSFVLWYNKKYGRVGHLFQDRFLSEPIDNDAYLLTALCYIHQNPVKSGLTTTCGDYPWSSYGAYVGGAEPIRGLTDVTLATELMGGTKGIVQLHQNPGNEELLDTASADKVSNSHAEQMIRQILKGRSIAELLAMDISDRRPLLRELKMLPGVSERQVAQLTGLSRGMIQRAWRA